MILDGKKVRDEILADLKRQIEEENLQVKLAIILVGDDEASKIYIKNKEAACQKACIEVAKYELPATIKEEELIVLIDSLNHDRTVTGIILQSPIPSNLDFDKCCSYIAASKDVDGFTKDNIYNLYLNKKTIMPCTVIGIIRLLEYYNISLDGANVVIIGRGNIVGKPLGLALLNKNATVTWCHSKTRNLKEITKMADIVVVATGHKHLLTADMIKNGAIVIDVGVSRDESHIVGDVDFENVKNVASAITPNPGGVGPMTVAMIMENLVNMERRKKQNG